MFILVPPLLTEKKEPNPASLEILIRIQTRIRPKDPDPQPWLRVSDVPEVSAWTGIWTPDRAQTFSEFLPNAHEILHILV